MWLGVPTTDDCFAKDLTRRDHFRESLCQSFISKFYNKKCLFKPVTLLKGKCFISLAKYYLSRVVCRHIATCMALPVHNLV